VRLDPELVRRARRADLVAYLLRRGHRLVREGRNWRVPGGGGLVIQNNFYFHFATGEGGNALDFLTRVLGLPFREAVAELAGLAPSAPPPAPTPARPRAADPSPFAPPPRARPKDAARYLTQVRGLPQDLVAEVLLGDLLYQDERGKCVFPCRDRSGAVRGAFLRGTKSDFKALAPGSDSRWGWHLPPGEEDAAFVAVVESPIDGLSLAALKPPVRAGHVLSLNGLRRAALDTFLAEWLKVDLVILALDADGPGEEATAAWRPELEARGYRVLRWSPAPHKDWNEALLATRG
jgi:hypothetical protein